MWQHLIPQHVFPPSFSLCPPPRRLQRPTAQCQCHRSSGCIVQRWDETSCYLYLKWKPRNTSHFFQITGGLMAQAVRRSPPTAGGPEFASRSLHVGFVVDETGSGQVFHGVSPVFPLPQISFHHFSTLISSISFHFIRPCDGASGVVSRHLCYSQTYNIGASSHLIPRPDLVLNTS